MVFLVVFAVAIFLWPRFILYFFAAPFLGAILGAFVWVMAMFASGCSMSLTTIGPFVVGGMILATLYAIFWANSNDV